MRQDGGGKHGRAVGEVLAATLGEGLDASEVARAPEDAQAGLTDRERLVLRRRLGFDTSGPRSQRGLAEELSVLPQSVSRRRAGRSRRSAGGS